MPEALGSNIWKYTLLLITNKRVFVAIVSVYYLTIPGVTTWWVGILMAIGNVAGFILEIPSGYFADKVGHRETLIISRVLAVCSTLFYLFASSVWLLVLGSIFLSASFAFHSGTGAAFMHETLRGLGREKEYQAVTGKQSSIGFAVPAVLMTLVPFLVDISFRVPFVVALILDLIGVVTAFALVAPPVRPEQVKEVRAANARDVFREGLDRRFFRFAIFAGLLTGVLTGFSTFRAPYQLLLGVPVIWFGVFFGAGRALASLLLAYTGRIHRSVKDIFAFERIQMVIYAILIAGLAFISHPWVVVGLFLLINAFQWGFTQLSTGYFIEILRDSGFKATLLSIKSQINNIFTAIVSFSFGYGVQVLGYQPAFGILLVLLLLVLIPLYFYNLRAKETLPL